MCHSNFPGNCYSEDLIGNPHLLRSIAKGTGMIGAAEELLWPAERLAAEVAILYPRSSFFWDQQDVELPHGIMDCTNVNMGSGPDYLREVYGLYQTLATQLNIPVDFLDEDEMLVPASLAKLKVIFVTEPDLPLAAGAALVAWVRAGGTLVTVAGAGAFDRYDEPSPTFQTALGCTEKPKKRDISAPAGNGTGTKVGSLSTPLPGRLPGTTAPTKFQAWARPNASCSLLASALKEVR